jgi:hypothetical protein
MIIIIKIASTEVHEIKSNQMYSTTSISLVHYTPSSNHRSQRHPTPSVTDIQRLIPDQVSADSRPGVG